VCVCVCVCVIFCHFCVVPLRSIENCSSDQLSHAFNAYQGFRGQLGIPGTATNSRLQQV
jgi:hypothetical protein